MARTARADIGGICYHVLNRGNGRATVFHDPADFMRFLDLVANASRRYDVEVFAYCLMPNHFHLVARPGSNGGLGRWMHWVLTSYVRRHGVRYGAVGRIWQGRFKAFPIEHDRHLLTVVRYVEQNALRADLVQRAEDWRWGSLPERLGLSDRMILTPPPVSLPVDWDNVVNTRETSSTLEELRTCVARGRPYGSGAWSRGIATRFGLSGKYFEECPPEAE